MKGIKQKVELLLVEDDYGHATLLRRNLERRDCGHRILHFIDGQEILDFLFPDGENARLPADRFYILLLDLRLPKIYGIDILRRIKENVVLQRMPVIIISTMDEKKELDNAYGLGCDAYIVKPIDYDLLVEAVRRLSPAVG